MTAVSWKFSKKYHVLIKQKFFNYRCFCAEQIKLTEKDVEEIKIPVPWGHIAGKWWGPKNRRPVLCVHGWQDNANTFDTLIPQLPEGLSFLAIDLPGHGFSSHLPKGLFYKTYEMMGVFRRLQQFFNWKKLSLMGHSYGAACSFLFASCFPNDTDFFIAIDTIKPLTQNSEKQIKHASHTVEKLLRYESLTSESAPAYSRGDLLHRWIKGSSNSLNEKSCKILMERGTINVDGLFKLTRDCRVKTSFVSGFSQNELLNLAKFITCNVLFIKAKNAPWFEKKENVLDVVKIIKRNAKIFEYHELSGTHHLHLNNPELVTPVIGSFIINFRDKNR